MAPLPESITTVTAGKPESASYTRGPWLAISRLFQSDPELSALWMTNCRSTAGIGLTDYGGPAVQP